MRPRVPVFTRICRGCRARLPLSAFKALSSAARRHARPCCRVVLLWYTLETRGMRQEMFKTRLRVETPEVFVYLDRTLDPSAYSGFFDVIVENPSQEPAFDVTFTEVPDLPVGAGRRTRDIGFLRHGVRHLAPGQKYRAFFLNYPQLGDEQQHRDVQFDYSFKDRTGRQHSRVITMNLSVYFDAMNLGRPFEAGLLNELRLIRETLKRLPLQGGSASI
jgi:hypothetical protein